MSATAARAGAGGAARIAGIDLARALAVIGMLAVHVGPTDADGVGGTLYRSLTHGRAAILFGLLAGVGVSLLAASRTSSPAETRVRLLWRAVVLLPLGLALQLLDHNVFVILQDYALLFVLGLFVVHLPDRWLLGLAATSWLAGPVGYLWGTIAWPEAFLRDAARWGDPMGETLHRLVLSGPYPLITWSAPFLVGMWLGRRDLRTHRAPGRLLLSGGVTLVVAVSLSRGLVALLGEPGEADWTRLVIDDPHSQMPLWLLGATGSAVAALGGSLLLARALPRGVWPLVAVGQLAFTVYVAHLLALHLDTEALTSDAPGEATLLVVGFTVVAALLAVVWRAWLPRGPLEVVLHLPALAARAHEP